MTRVDGLGSLRAFIVEPKGSKYLDPGTGAAPDTNSGWQVMIDNGSGPDFREFVLFYHEIGDEAFRPLNKKGDFLPQRDPLTDAYRPGPSRSTIAASRSASIRCICSMNISVSKMNRWPTAPTPSVTHPPRWLAVTSVTR